MSSNIGGVRHTLTSMETSPETPSFVRVKMRSSPEIEFLVPRAALRLADGSFPLTHLVAPAHLNLTPELRRNFARHASAPYSAHVSETAMIVEQVLRYGLQVIMDRETLTSVARLRHLRAAEWIATIFNLECAPDLARAMRATLGERVSKREFDSYPEIRGTIFFPKFSQTDPETGFFRDECAFTPYDGNLCRIG